jgi:hypothetical protein
MFALFRSPQTDGFIAVSPVSLLFHPRPNLSFYGLLDSA